MNPHDMQRVLAHLKRDPVVKAVYDAKSEEIGPNIFRFKAEIGAPLECSQWHCGTLSWQTRVPSLLLTCVQSRWKHV